MIEVITIEVFSGLMLIFSVSMIGVGLALLLNEYDIGILLVLVGLMGSFLFY